MIEDNRGVWSRTDGLTGASGNVINRGVHTTKQIGDITIRITSQSPLTLEKMKDVIKAMEKVAEESRLKEIENRSEEEKDDPTINLPLTKMDYAKFRQQNSLAYMGRVGIIRKRAQMMAMSMVKISPRRVKRFRKQKRR